MSNTNKNNSNTPLDERVIECALSTGGVIPFRPIRAQNKADGSLGNMYHATLSTKGNGQKYYSRYGVTVAPSVIGDDTLPESVVVNGVTFAAEHGLTGKDESPDNKRNPKVSFTGTITLQDGDSTVERVFYLRISRIKTGDNAGNFNLAGSIRRAGGSANSGKAAVTEL